MQHEPRHKLTVKIGDALRTIQGYTDDEFGVARAELIDGLQADLEAIQLAKAVTNAAPLVTAAAPAAPAADPTGWGAPAPAPTPDYGRPGGPAPSFAQAATPSCQHGPRTPRSGTGAKGPWKAYFCPLPSSRKAEQCNAVWLTRGTPEWDAFAG